MRRGVGGLVEYLRCHQVNLPRKIGCAAHITDQILRHRAGVEGVAISGKTGTAEYGLKELNQKRGWMIAYAPSDNPRYAVAVVIEDAMSGGVTAAPRIKTLMEGLFGVHSAGEGEG